MNSAQKNVRSLTPETVELISKLRPRKKHFWERLWQKIDPIPVILEIRQRNEPAAIPYILDFTLDNDPAVVKAAESTLEALLLLVPISDVSWLDQHVRHHAPWRGRWTGLKPSSFRGTTSEACLLMATFHPNGFVREKALRLLTNIQSTTKVPYIIIRLNDWAKEVRQVSRTLLLDRLGSEFAPQIVQNLPLILRLDRCGRSDHSQIISKVSAFLISEPGMAALLDGLSSLNKGVRRACFEVGSVLSGRELENVLSAALKSNDPVLRLFSARILIEKTDQKNAGALVLSLLKDKFSPVRLVALRAAYDLLPEKPCELLRASLLDRNASIRWYCQYYLKTYHSFDPAASYRAALTSEDRATVVSALRGLCESGDKNDVEYSLAQLDSIFPSIRASAIKLIGTFGATNHHEVICNALFDPAPSVAKEAVTAMKRLEVTIDVSFLNKLLRMAPHPHTGQICLGLTDRVSRWSRPQILIPACFGNNDATNKKAQAALSLWLSESRSVGLMQTEQEAFALARVVDEYRHLLPKNQVAEFGYLLRLSIRNT